MKFLAENADLAWAIISGLMFLVGAAAGLVVKIKMGHIDFRDNRQDERLSTLELKIADLEGNERVTKNDLQHINEKLRLFLEELKGQIAQNQKHQATLYDEIKSLIMRGHARSLPKHVKA